MSVASDLWHCCLQLFRHNRSSVQVHFDVGSSRLDVLLSTIVQALFSIVQVHFDVGSLGFVVLLSTIVQAKFINCAGSCQCR